MPIVAATSSSQTIDGPSGNSSLAFSTKTWLVTIVRRPASLRRPPVRISRPYSSRFTMVFPQRGAATFTRAAATVGGKRTPTRCWSFQYGSKHSRKDDRSDERLQGRDMGAILVGHGQAERIAAHRSDKFAVKRLAMLGFRSCQAASPSSRIFPRNS